MPGASNLAIVLFLQALFISGIHFVPQPFFFFLIDKVTWPRHAKSLLACISSCYYMYTGLEIKKKFKSPFGD